MNTRLFSRKDRLRPFSVAGAAAFILLVGAAALAGPKAAAGAYLWAWLFWLGPCAGSLALIMIHTLTGGRWGEALMPVLRPAAMAVPLLAVLFFPVLLGVGLLYPWAGNPEAASAADVARLYLNVPAFVLRAVLILSLWSALSILFAWRGGAGPLFAGLGLAVYGVTATVAAVDWSMSADPRFVSTAFGANFVVSQLLAGLALAGIWRAGSEPGSAARDLGGLLMTALLGLAYLEFMQYLVIWAGGLPEKSAWYLLRASDGWNHLVAAVFIVGVLLPFLILLPSRVRSSPRGVALASALVFAGLLLLWRWRMAGIDPQRIAGLSDIAAPLALGGLLAAWMYWRGERQGESTR